MSTHAKKEDELKNNVSGESNKNDNPESIKNQVFQ